MAAPWSNKVTVHTKLYSIHDARSDLARQQTAIPHGNHHNHKSQINLKPSEAANLLSVHRKKIYINTTKC